MQYIISNVVDPRSRTVVCSLYQEDGKTPYAGSLVGVKMNFVSNQVGGATLTSTNDVQRVATGSAKVFVVLSQLESATFAPGDRVTAFVAASPSNFLRWEEDVLVLTQEITGPPLSLEQMKDDAISVVQSFRRTNTEVTLTGSSGPVVMPAVTDNTLNPIREINPPI